MARAATRAGSCFQRRDARFPAMTAAKRGSPRSLDGPDAIETNFSPRMPKNKGQYRVGYRQTLGAVMERFGDKKNVAAQNEVEVAGQISLSSTSGLRHGANARHTAASPQTPQRTSTAKPPCTNVSTKQGSLWGVRNKDSYCITPTVGGQILDLWSSRSHVLRAGGPAVFF